MATARPVGAPGCLFTGYTHDFYVRRVYGRNVGLRHDNGVMPCSAGIPEPRLAAGWLDTTRPCAAEKTGPRKGPGFSICRRGGRQHRPEGNKLRTGDSGRIRIRRNSEYGVCERQCSASTPMAACQPCVVAVVRCPLKSRDDCDFRQPKHEMLNETKSASAVRWRQGSRGRPGCARLT